MRSCHPSFFSNLDEEEKNRIYHRVMEEKVSPQLVSQETGFSVVTIRNLIKEKGGKLPSRYTHTASKAPTNKPAGEPTEQPQQPMGGGRGGFGNNTGCESDFIRSLHLGRNGSKISLLPSS